MVGGNTKSISKFMIKPILSALLLLMPIHTQASCAPPSLSTGFEERSDTALTDFIVNGSYHSASFSGGLANTPSPSNLAIEGNNAWQVYSANNSSTPESTGIGTITLTPPAIDLEFVARAAPDISARAQVIDTGNNVVLEQSVETDHHSFFVIRRSENELPIAEIHLIIDGGIGQAAIDRLYFHGNSESPPCNDTMNIGQGAIDIVELLAMLFLILWHGIVYIKGKK